MDQSLGYIAQEASLQFFNGQAVINLVIPVFYDDEEETEFQFPGYQSAYLKVYDERDGQLLKNLITQITRNSNFLILNCSVADMTFEDIGKYWFVLGYTSSGYEIAIRFGDFLII